MTFGLFSISLGYVNKVLQVIILILKIIIGLLQDLVMTLVVIKHQLNDNKSQTVRERRYKLHQRNSITRNKEKDSEKYSTTFKNRLYHHEKGNSTKNPKRIYQCRYIKTKGPSAKARRKKVCNPNHPMHPCNNCNIKAYQMHLGRTHPMLLDTDSYLIAIDNHSSCSMTNNLNDFIHPPEPKRFKVKGFQGATSFSYGIGTIKWPIEDDEGLQHDVIIKDALYVPKAKQRLFRPQQWSQQQNDTYPIKRGTYVVQDKDVIELHWSQNKYTKTIPWDRNTNTVFMRTSPQYNKAIEFNKQFMANNKQSGIEHAYTCKSINIQTLDEVRELNLLFETNKLQSTDKLQQEETMMIQSTTMQGKLLSWHYRLGHLSFNKLKLLAIQFQGNLQK